MVQSHSILVLIKVKRMKRKVLIFLASMMTIIVTACSVGNPSVNESTHHISTPTSDQVINNTTPEPTVSSPEPVDNHTHIFDEWIMISNPTETESGLMERVCLTCNYKETEVIPKLSHVHQFSDNCIYDNNQHWYECSCGAKDSITNHVFDEWTIIKEATENSTGVKERACLVCGYRQKEEMPTLSHTHSFSDLWLSDNDQHWHMCSCGEKDSIANHIYGDTKTSKIT